MTHLNRALAGPCVALTLFAATSAFAQPLATPAAAPQEPARAGLILVGEAGMDHAHPAGIAVETPWMRQPPPGAKVAGAYLTIANTGDTADRLVGGSATFATRVEVHEMKTENGMMMMNEVEGGLEIAPGATVDLAPGSYHLMLMGLTSAPGAGETVPMSLTFEKAGTIDVMVEVAPMGAMRAPEGHAGAGHGHGAMKHAAD